MKKLTFLLFLLPALNAIGQNPPDISLIFYIDENSENSTLIGTVSATDPDGDPLTYAITSGNELGAFAMDATSGQLTVADVLQLDFETTQFFALMVEADDGNGGMTIVSITVNLNDIDENALGVADDTPFTIYPNPAKDVLSIDLGSIRASETRIFLRTLSGQNISVDSKNVSSTEVQVDTKRLKAGVYLLRIESEDEQKTLRVVKAN